MRTPLPRPVLGALVSILVVGMPAVAEADVQASSLEWDAPPGCPSRDEVLAKIRGIVHSTPTDPPRARVTVSGPPWTARIVVDRDGERGARVLEASSCEALGHAVALVVALSIDRAEQAPPPPAPPPPAPSPSPPAPGTEARDAPSSPDRARDRAAIFAGLTLGTGLLPSVAPGAVAGVAYRLGPVELSARGSLFTRSSSGAVQGATGSFFLASAEGRLAWITSANATIGFVPYAGLSIAYLRGDGRGDGRGSFADDNATDWLPIPLLGLEVRARLGHGLEPFVGVDAGLPIGRSTFRFDGADDSVPVHKPSSIATRMSLGLRVALF